MMIGHVLLVAT